MITSRIYNITFKNCMMTSRNFDIACYVEFTRCHREISTCYVGLLRCHHVISTCYVEYTRWHHINSTRYVIFTRWYHVNSTFHVEFTRCYHVIQLVMSKLRDGIMLKLRDVIM